MTTEQLIDMVIECVNGPDFEVIDVWFPETRFSSKSGDHNPLTEWEILKRMPQLVGKTFVTVSEIPILFFMRAIRKGQMRTDEVELWCGDRRIELSTKGEFIDMWDGGFFETGFHLRFS
jgi:hypothetical protein